MSRVTITVEDTQDGRIKVVSDPPFSTLVPKHKAGQVSPAEDLAILVLGLTWQRMTGKKTNAPPKSRLIL